MNYVIVIWYEKNTQINYLLKVPKVKQKVFLHPLEKLLKKQQHIFTIAFNYFL